MRLAVTVFCSGYPELQRRCRMHFYGVGINERVDSCYKSGMAEGFNEHSHSLEDRGAQFSTKALMLLGNYSKSRVVVTACFKI